MEEGGEGGQARQAGPATLKPPARATAARWIALAWLVAFAWVASWALAIGRYGGPDEPAHVIRAAAVAQGEVRGASSPTARGGFRAVTVPAELATGDPACYRHDPRLPAACAVGSPRPGSATVLTAAGANPPWYYAAVGAVARLVGGDASSLAHRLVASALHALLLALIAWRLRGTDRWSVTILVATITPAAWFLTAVVNPNSAETLLCLLAALGVAGAIDAHRRGTSTTARDAAWVGVPLGVAVLVRPLSLLAAVAAIALVGFGTRGTRGWRLPSRAALLAPVVVGAAASAWWNAAVGFAFDDPRTASSLSGWPALRHALAGVPDTLHEVAGSWSWMEVRVPWPVQLAWAVAAGWLVVAGWRCAGLPLRLGLAAWAVVLLLAPVAFEVVEARRVGFIWQGRYSVPTMVLLAALALVGPARPRRERTVAIVTAIVAACEIGVFWWSLRRFTVGTDGSWGLTSGPAGVWRPQLDPRLLLAAHAVLVVTLAAGWARRTEPAGAEGRAGDVAGQIV